MYETIKQYLDGTKITYFQEGVLKIFVPGDVKGTALEAEKVACLHYILNYQYYQDATNWVVFGSRFKYRGSYLKPLGKWWSQFLTDAKLTKTGMLPSTLSLLLERKIESSPPVWTKKKIGNRLVPGSDARRLPSLGFRAGSGMSR